MSFTMPQAQDNPTWAAQAVPDSTDFAVITAGEAGHGIINGLATTVASASAYTYKVTVATGTFTISGVAYSLGSATTVTGIVAGAGDRKDLVSINSAGAVTLTTGTTSTVTNWQTTSAINPPIKPSIPSSNVALAEVYVPGSGSYTTPAATWITDKSLVLLTSGTIASGSAASGDLKGTYPSPSLQGHLALASNTTNTVITGNTTQYPYIFNTALSTYGSYISYSNSTGYFNIKKDGIYQFNWAVSTTTTTGILGTYVNASGQVVGNFYGTTLSLNTTTSGATLTGGFATSVLSGSYWGLAIQNKTATNITLNGAAGFQVSVFMTVAYLGAL